MTVLVEQGNTWVRLSGLQQELVGAIDAATSYPTETAQRGTWAPPEAIMGQEVWDGWVHLSRFPAPGVAVVPAGLMDLTLEQLTRWGLPYQLTDHRIRPEMGVPDRGAIPLRPYQRQAVEALWARGQGVLDMPPRSGKTRTMLETLRGIALPALWIVPTRNIGRQTQAAAEEFFGRNWAVFASGRAEAEEAARYAMTVICVDDTAANMPPEWFARFQALVFDEAHHQAAASWRAVALKCPHVYFRFGMSGTFFRSGADELAMQAVLSRVVFRITPDELRTLGFLVQGDVVFLPVDGPRVTAKVGATFQTGVGGAGIYRHEHRAQLAAWAASTLWSRNKKTVVLVATKEQGRAIAALLEAFLPRAPGSPWKPVEFVSTDRPPQVCEAVIKAFTSGRDIPVLIGTSMIGEGTDLPDSDALVYAMGGKAEVSHTQAAYRVLTAVPGKRRAVLVDFADRHHETLLRHAQERLATYHASSIFRVQVLQDVGQLPAWLDAGEANGTPDATSRTIGVGGMQQVQPSQVGPASRVNHSA